MKPLLLEVFQLLKHYVKVWFQIKWNGVAGILNGTTNYILTEMKNNGLSFETALSQAQSLGYAEADPTFDIEGIDAAHKKTIIASIAFGVSFKL